MHIRIQRVAMLGVLFGWLMATVGLVVYREYPEVSHFGVAVLIASAVVIFGSFIWDEF